MFNFKTVVINIELPKTDIKKYLTQKQLTVGDD